MTKYNICSRMLFVGLTASHLLWSQSFRLQSDQLGMAGVNIELWNANKQTISQFALPMTYIYPFSDKARFYAITSPALSFWNTESNYHLMGLSDIKMGGHLLILNDALLLTFGLNVPIGKEELSVQESPLASEISNPAFDFGVPILGQGADLQIGVNTAWEWGDYIVGYGISLVLKGSYRPLASYDSRYDPGNEVSFTWGLSREMQLFNRDMKLSADLLYTGYGSDQFGDAQFFSSGNRALIQVMSQFKENNMDMTILIRDRIKGKNEFIYDPSKDGSHGNQLELLAYGYYPMQQDLRVKGVVDLKLYANNKSNIGGANLIGFGGGGEKRIDQQLSANGEMRLYFGRLKYGGDWIGAFGIKIFAGITYTF